MVDFREKKRIGSIPKPPVLNQMPERIRPFLDGLDVQIQSLVQEIFQAGLVMQVSIREQPTRVSLSLLPEQNRQDRARALFQALLANGYSSGFNRSQEATTVEFSLEKTARSRSITCLQALQVTAGILFLMLKMLVEPVWSSLSHHQEVATA